MPIIEAIKTGFPSGWYFDQQVGRISVEGAEASEFLNGQLTLDVMRQPINTLYAALVLQPQGKTDFITYVNRVDENSFQLFVDIGASEFAFGRLKKYLIRTKATIDLDSVVMRHVDSNSIGIKSPWSQDVNKVIFKLGCSSSDGTEQALKEVDEEAFESLRIALRIPKQGFEVTSSVIPGELLHDDVLIDREKGCYVGQELVERIAARGGNFSKRLCVLDVDNPDDLPANIIVGSQISKSVSVSGKKSTGWVTSAACYGENKIVAIGFVGKSIPDEARVIIDTELGPLGCIIN